MRTHPCKSKSCVEGRLFTVNTHHSPSRGSKHCSQTWLCMWKNAYWEGFVSYVMRLYIVSTCLWKSWWPTWCHMFNVTHRNDFVTQKVSRHPSLSMWTRAWTRLVVDTLRGYMSVEPKNRKLWDKLYTYTSCHEKIACGHVHVSQKLAQRGVFSQWIQITGLRAGQTNDLSRDFICEKLHTFTSSYVKICTWRRPRKSK